MVLVVEVGGIIVFKLIGVGLHSSTIPAVMSRQRVMTAELCCNLKVGTGATAVTLCRNRVRIIFPQNLRANLPPKDSGSVF